MSEIVVWGVVPVGIHVDTDSGLVTRVVVIDESLQYPKDIDTPLGGEGELAVSDTAYHTYWGDLGSDAEVKEAREEAAKALAIASGDTEEPWPAWEFGY